MVRVEPRCEAELARAMLAGETDAFEHFVEHFRSKVFRYSWLMCGSPEDAEDVAQETLLRVFQSIDQLRDPEYVRSWVFRIARNVCLMQRRHSVFAPTEELPADEVPLPDTAAPADERLLHAELRAVVERVIVELPPTYRSVVLLRDLEGLSTDDTAQILDLSLDVVKTRLHRGRAAMRQKLDCYVHNRCLDDLPRPDPAPLSPEERERLYSAWAHTV
jgi:RNA polymerase sigma-70 factor (ECF subfamily)